MFMRRMTVNVWLNGKVNENKCKIKSDDRFLRNETMTFAWIRNFAKIPLPLKRIFVNDINKCSFPFVQAAIIDGRGHLVGRLASVVAKNLLQGGKVVVVRCEELTLSGHFYR